MMKTKGKHIVAALATAAVIVLYLGSDRAYANLLTNGDFEMGNLTGWTWTPTQYPDPNMTTAVVSFDTSGSGASLAFTCNPGSDQDHAFLSDEGGTLSQTVSLTGGTIYQVEVGAAAMKENGLGDNFVPGRIRLFVGGDLLWDWWVTSQMSIGTTVRSSYAGTYTPAVSGDYDVNLLFTRKAASVGWPDYKPAMSHYADNVSIVPEPLTLSLLLTGAVAAFRRRSPRRKNSRG